MEIGEAQGIEGRQQSFIDTIDWVSVCTNTSHASGDIPSIDISHNNSCSSLSMDANQVLLDPGDEMILKRSLDDLMQYIRCQEAVNISSGEADCKWLSIYGQ